MILFVLVALHGSPPNDGGFRAAAHVLSNHCVRCHNADKTRGGLDISTRETTLAGGATSEALVPGDFEKSSLYQRAAEGSMPPSKDGQRLSSDELEVLSRWITQGTSWPKEVTLPLGRPQASVLPIMPSSQQPWRRRRRTR
jgi:uncharacterized membrane protein